MGNSDEESTGNDLQEKGETISPGLAEKIPGMEAGEDSRNVLIGIIYGLGALFAFWMVLILAFTAGLYMIGTDSPDTATSTNPSIDESTQTSQNDSMESNRNKQLSDQEIRSSFRRNLTDRGINVEEVDPPTKGDNVVYLIYVTEASTRSELGNELGVIASSYADLINMGADAESVLISIQTGENGLEQASARSRHPGLFSNLMANSPEWR